ncbi:MAG TPA: hypothetical protein VG796_15740 [Verrucomicrobiales bacterium]|nr:hypothetical protein [Verrucomicrobiales bacterium]
MNITKLTLGSCLLIAASGPAFADLFWDGPGPANDGIVQGGSGTWDNLFTTTNWTDATGSTNRGWDNTGGDRNAVFGGLSGGTVSIEGSNVSGSIDPQRMRFTRTGYLITNVNDPLSLIGGMIFRSMSIPASRPPSRRASVLPPGQQRSQKPGPAHWSSPGSSIVETCLFLTVLCGCKTVRMPSAREATSPA